MRPCPPLSILVIGGDGRRVLCLRVSPRRLAAALLVVLAMAATGELSPLIRRSPVTAAAAPTAAPATVSVDQGQPGEDLAQQQRLAAIEHEMTSWREAQDALRRTLRVHPSSSPPARSTEPSEPDASLSSRLDRLLASLKAEAQNLRALEPYAAQAARALAGLPSRWPVRAAVSSEFGRRISPWSGSPEFHRGIDIAARPGTRITAPSPGSVAFIGASPAYGNTVVLDHGNGVRTLFGHLEQATVQVGQRVEQGQAIALSGSTGHSTGPHLHYEVTVRGRPVNPRAYLVE
jgi:murein DD-endopeptidase MepM/ murein hydrolase activator NlpD